MKKLFLGCSLLAATIMYAPSIMAQNAPTPAPSTTPSPMAAPGGPAQRQPLTPDQRAEKRAEMMQKNLGLSNGQFTKVKQINIDFENQIDQARKNNTDPQQMHTQMKTLRDKYNDDIKGVLTPEQYAKMQEMQQGRGPQHQGTPQTPPQPQNK